MPYLTEIEWEVMTVAIFFNQLNHSDGCALQLSRANCIGAPSIRSHYFILSLSLPLFDQEICDVNQEINNSLVINLAALILESFMVVCII